MKSRLDFLEDGIRKPLRIEEPEPLEEKVNYPVLARYDFAGNGPRQGIRRDVWLYRQAAVHQTFGERISPTVMRICWIVIRLAFALAILFFMFGGRTFSCQERWFVFR